MYLFHIKNVSGDIHEKYHSEINVPNICVTMFIHEMFTIFPFTVFFYI